MTDLRPTIVPKSDQLNADDLIGRSITVKITKVSLCGEADQPIAVHYEGDNGKPYKPCKSMRRVMVSIWGPDGNVFVGRSMTLYRDDKVQFGGLAVGGIRISHMSDIDREVTMALTATRANRKPFTVRPLRNSPAPRQTAAEAPADDFPGDLHLPYSAGGADRPAGGDGFDPLSWAAGQNKLIDAASRVADIDALAGHPDAGENFAALQAHSPGAATALQAAMKGKRKALADKERAQ